MSVKSYRRLNSTQVPLSQPWFAGVANVRGNLYSVADFSAFCGGEPVSVSAEKRLVLAHPKFMVNSGLLVSRLLGSAPCRPVAAERHSRLAQRPGCAQNTPIAKGITGRN